MTRKWLFIALLIGLMALFIAGLVLMRNFAAQALEPINDASRRIGTQASQFLYPTATILPDPVTIINQVRPLARLETIQYSVEKIITAESRQEIFGALFGDRLLFVAHGMVIAGVDLSKLTAEDIRVVDGMLEVKLPEAEIFVVAIDNGKSYVYDRETGILTKPAMELETLARQSAEEEIRKSALSDGILDQGMLNAEVFLERLLDDLGFDEVIFVKN